MPTSFPGADDVFDVPSTPISTVLADAGDSARTHSQSHLDLGDALMAMQAQATLKIHSHDGSTLRHGSKLAQANTHQSPDTDTSTSALHHTVGSGANQYASGAHTHPVVITYPIGAFFLACVATYPGVTDPISGTPGLGLVGSWAAVGERFLCASDGALGFPPGTTGGSNSHSHSIDASTSTESAHAHTLSSAATGSSGGHSHATNGTTSTVRTHFHTATSTGTTHAVKSGDEGGGPQLTAHAHTSTNSSPSHSHSTSTSGSVADHSHTLPSTALGSSSSHSHANSSPASANNLVPLFVVYMWRRVS